MSDHARVATGPERPFAVDELILPVSPANIRTGGRFRTEEVTNDMYNISERLRELNPNLYINIIEDRMEGAMLKVWYVIMQRTLEGDEQMVFRCKQLDGRVIEYVRYLLQVPFSKRYAEAEKMEKKWEDEAHENEMDELVERLGLPMLREMRETGFLNGVYSKPDVARSRKGFGKR